MYRIGLIKESVSEPLFTGLYSSLSRGSMGNSLSAPFTDNELCCDKTIKAVYHIEAVSWIIFVDVWTLGIDNSSAMQIMVLAIYIAPLGNKL